MKQLFMVLGAFGFLFLLGTAGAMDADSLGLGALLFRLVVGMASLGISYGGIRYCEQREIRKKISYLRRVNARKNHAA